MNVIVKAVIPSVLIMMAMASFTNILAGESDGIDNFESNDHSLLIGYITELKTQDFTASLASHEGTVNDCATIVNNTLPFQESYKKCEITIKKVYSEFATL